MPTPEQIHEYDQGLAEINDMIDSILATYRQLAIDPRLTPEMALLGLIHILNKSTENQYAACQYLGVALHRLNENNLAIEKIIADTTTQPGGQ